MSTGTFVKVKVLVAQLCLTLCDPWTVACQTPLSMEFSRQEYWSGLPFPSPAGLPDPGMEHKTFVAIVFKMFIFLDSASYNIPRK